MNRRPCIQKHREYFFSSENEPELVKLGGSSQFPDEVFSKMLLLMVLIGELEKEDRNNELVT